MTIEKGLTRRLGRGLILQAIYISLAVLVGIFVAAGVVENVLIEQALKGEAEYYWEQESNTPGHALPDTKNMTGYRDGVGRGVPEALQGLKPGFHAFKEPRELLTLVSIHDGKTLYLEFEVEQVDELVTLFGVIPLALALTVIYLSLFSAYRVSRRAVSPIISLAQQVQKLDPGNLDPADITLDPTDDPEEEITILSDALQDLIHKVTEFAERERRFTRDASHELRTPLTVIKMAAERLMMNQETGSRDHQMCERIRSSASDMERLTEAFLLLAREWDQGLAKEWVCINDVAALELERMQIIYPDAPISTQIEAECSLFILAPTKVVESVIGNLVRNAFNYTDSGSVTVFIGKEMVAIEDTGSGMEREEMERIFEAFYSKGRQRGGFGVGLTIVKRLTDRFGWPVQFDSEPGEGTTVTVRFPDARCDPVTE